MISTAEGGPSDRTETTLFLGTPIPTTTTSVEDTWEEEEAWPQRLVKSEESDKSMNEQEPVCYEVDGATTRALATPNDTPASFHFDSDMATEKSNAANSVSPPNNSSRMLEYSSSIASRRSQGSLPNIPTTLTTPTTSLYAGLSVSPTPAAELSEDENSTVCFVSSTQSPLVIEQNSSTKSTDTNISVRTGTSDEIQPRITSNSEGCASDDDGSRNVSQEHPLLGAGSEVASSEKDPKAGIQSGSTSQSTINKTFTDTCAKGSSETGAKAIQAGSVKSATATMPELETDMYVSQATTPGGRTTSTINETSRSNILFEEITDSYRLRQKNLLYEKVSIASENLSSRRHVDDGKGESSRFCPDNISIIEYEDGCFTENQAEDANFSSRIKHTNTDYLITTSASPTFSRDGTSSSLGDTDLSPADFSDDGDEEPDQGVAIVVGLSQGPDEAVPSLSLGAVRALAQHHILDALKTETVVDTLNYISDIKPSPLSTCSSESEAEAQQPNGLTSAAEGGGTQKMHISPHSAECITPEIQEVVIATELLSSSNRSSLSASPRSADEIGIPPITNATKSPECGDQAHSTPTTIVPPSVLGIDLRHPAAVAEGEALPEVIVKKRCVATSFPHAHLDLSPHDTDFVVTCPTVDVFIPTAPRASPLTMRNLTPARSPTTTQAASFTDDTSFNLNFNHSIQNFVSTTPLVRSPLVQSLPDVPHPDIDSPEWRRRPEVISRDSRCSGGHLQPENQRLAHYLPSSQTIQTMPSLPRIMSPLDSRFRLGAISTRALPSVCKFQNSEARSCQRDADGSQQCILMRPSPLTPHGVVREIPHAEAARESISPARRQITEVISHDTRFVRSSPTASDNRLENQRLTTPAPQTPIRCPNPLLNTFDSCDANNARNVRRLMAAQQRSPPWSPVMHADYSHLDLRTDQIPLASPFYSHRGVVRSHGEYLHNATLFTKHADTFSISNARPGYTPASGNSINEAKSAKASADVPQLKNLNSNQACKAESYVKYTTRVSDAHVTASREPYNRLTSTPRSSPLAHLTKSAWPNDDVNNVISDTQRIAQTQRHLKTNQRDRSQIITSSGPIALCDNRVHSLVLGPQQFIAKSPLVRPTQYTDCITSSVVSDSVDVGALRRLPEAPENFEIASGEGPESPCRRYSRQAVLRSVEPKLRLGVTQVSDNPLNTQSSPSVVPESATDGLSAQHNRQSLSQIPAQTASVVIPRTLAHSFASLPTRSLASRNRPHSVDTSLWQQNPSVTHSEKAPSIVRTAPHPFSQSSRIPELKKPVKKSWWSCCFQTIND